MNTERTQKDSESVLRFRRHCC